MNPLPRLLSLCLLLVCAAPLWAGPPPTCLSDYQCADGNLCNGIEHCHAGTCTPSTAPLVCDDADSCTNDTCDPAVGCAHADVACAATCGPGDDGLRCSDGTACTLGDTCTGGACVGTPLACDDGDPCTTDACDATLGCVYAEQADPPACVPSSQCFFAADHTPCVADGDPCTQDGCLEGACRTGLNQILRQCSDGDACNGDEFCSAVKGCEPGPPPACDDGDACNGVESCVAATGCVAGTSEPDGTGCDDGRTCTATDACDAGTCVGTPLTCDDADVSTADVCIESTGCLHCAPIAPRRLNLRFPTATKAGQFTASGRFIPATTLAPTTAAGLDFIVHDGPTVLQSSHVPGSAFTTSGGGTTARFVDRSGTLAQGIERVRMKIGAPGARHGFSASGTLTVPTLGHASGHRYTLRAGGTCATAIVACTASAGGKRDRCN